MNGINIYSNCQLIIDLCVPDESAIVEIKVISNGEEDKLVYHIDRIPSAWDNEVIIQAMEVTRNVKDEIRGAV